MKVFILRHAIREDGEEGGIDDGDPDAELTPEGEEIAHAVGKWMAEKEEIPTVLFVSPTVRTQQTAECICAEIESAGFVPPVIKTDVSIGPGMSIRGGILAAASDKSLGRVGFVSHHESIAAGLRELGRAKDGTPENPAPSPHLDQLAMGELRIVNVKRKSGKWEEQRRVLPSDLGLADHYS